MHFQLAAALLANIVLCGTAKQYSDLLEFDPPTFNFDDTKFDNKFRCRLKQKPDIPIQIYFEGAGLKFGNCSLTISDDQWQVVPVNTIPIFQTRPVEDIVIKTRVFYNQDKDDKEYKGKRTTTPSGTCHSVGDPHYQTLDDQSVTYMGEGIFDFFHHPQFQIQTTQGNCFGKGITCNHACSIRYGNSIMAIDLRTAGGLQMTQVTQNVDNIQYIPPKTGGEDDDNSAHTVTLPCGSKVVLTPNKNDKDKWIDISLTLAAGYTDYGGLVNQIGLPKGKFKCRDGKLVDDYKVFMETWKAPLSDYNIFKKFVPFNPVPVLGLVCTLPDAPTTPPTPPTPPILPPYVTPPPSTVTVVVTPTDTPTPGGTTTPGGNSTTPGGTTTPGGNSTTPGGTTTPGGNSTTPGGTTTPGGNSTTPGGTTTPGGNSTTPGSVIIVGTTTGVATTTIFTTTTVAPSAGTNTPANPSTPAPAAIPPPTPEYTNAVNKQCESIFVIKGCNDIIPIDFHVQACKSDCLATGNFAMAESHRIAYMAKCKAHVDYMHLDFVPAVVQQAQTIQTTCGLGGSACLNSCSGHGKCTVNGCTCDPGYSGMDCSSNLAALPAYNPAQQAYVVNTNTAAAASVFPPNPVTYAQDTPASAPATGAGNGSTPIIPTISGAATYSVSVAFAGLLSVMII